MKPTSLGSIIASRKLKNADGRTVRVVIGKPRRYRGGHADYYCPFRINGVDNRIQYASGVDAVQALQLVMKAIGSKLSEPGLTLQWEAGLEVGDLGFPGVETRNQGDPRLNKAVKRVFAMAFGKSIEAARRAEALTPKRRGRMQRKSRRAAKK